MNKQTEALKLALEALEDGQPDDPYPYSLESKAITAIREALAEQPAQQQEPVAVVSGYYGGQCVILPTNPARLFNSGTALYTSPPASKPWVGLTDEDLAGCDDEELKQARYWEAKLKEKNT